MADVLQRWVNSFRGKVHSLSASSPSEVECSLRELAQKTERVASLLIAGLSTREAAHSAELDLQAAVNIQERTPKAFLSVVWNFAVESGAAPSAVLNVCAEAFAHAAENARHARVQLSGPQAATHLVMTLPVVAVAGGYLAGYNPLAFLLSSFFGWVLLGGAGLLMFLSSRWSQRMVRHAQQWEWSRGMAAEAMAMSLSAGHSLAQARRWAAEVATLFTLNNEMAHQELARCDEFMELASRTGVGLAGLLRSQAQRERNAAREEAQMRVEKLAVRLMIPLGVCVLPAFIAVGVLPLVASVISSTALNS